MKVVGSEDEKVCKAFEAPPGSVIRTMHGYVVYMVLEPLGDSSCVRVARLSDGLITGFLREEQVVLYEDATMVLNG